MPEITPQEIANIVFKALNESLISMLNNSIKVTKNKRERQAYRNVINYIVKEDAKRIAAFSNEEKPESKIILIK